MYIVHQRKREHTNTLTHSNLYQNFRSQTKPHFCDETSAVYSWCYFSFYRPFPTEESVDDEDIYKGLPDLIEYVVIFS